MLKDVFTDCCRNYCTDNSYINLLWNEIEEAYSDKKRHYHNLSHLENLLLQLQQVWQQIQNQDAVLLAIFYHDIVYNVLKKDNEEKSVLFAVERLSDLGCNPPTIACCSNIIIATQKHELNEDSDVNYFTDADLSILGSDWNTYKKYADNVRKEYAFFPDIIYKPGRRKVLEHFLSMKQIFKTTHFFDLFEQKAKTNLKTELEQLS